MTCFFEPVWGTGHERRDQLGDFQSYRKHPHLGEDWGFSNGSEGKDIRNIHAGTVKKIWNDPALGWSATVLLSCPDNGCGYNGFTIEYNHMLKKPTIAVGAVLKGGTDNIGLIGATGSALSASGANHLHASMGKAEIPHTLPLDKKVAITKAIDKSSAERKAAKEAKA
jgi:hypothetical protein